MRMQRDNQLYHYKVTILSQLNSRSATMCSRFNSNGPLDSAWGLKTTP